MNISVPSCMRLGMSIYYYTTTGCCNLDILICTWNIAITKSSIDASNT
jgi:hypothetical protein